MTSLDYLTLVLGLIRDVDNALSFETIAERVALSKEALEEVIDELLKKTLICTFEHEDEKPLNDRRFFICKESLRQIRTIVREQMSQLSNKGSLFFAFDSTLHPGFMYGEMPQGGHFLMRGEILERHLVYQQVTGSQGGTAALEYSDTETVWGAAFYVTDRQWNELEKRIGAERNYEKIRVPVRTHFGIFCMETFNSVKSDKCLPPPEYLKRIIAGAEFFGLPRQYIRRLKNTPHFGEKKK